MSESEFEAPRHEIPRIVEQYGGPVSSALLDPSCHVFQMPGVDGAIGYRTVWGAAVAIGDPACAPEDYGRMADGFVEFGRQQGKHIVYAAAGKSFADVAIARNYAALEFGEELILDPTRDPTAGSAGRELRKKIYKATREGVEVVEYQRRAEAPDRALEEKLEQVAVSWLGARHGPQIYIARVELFGTGARQRWFYAHVGDKIVGVMSAVHLASRHGYLFDHLLCTPDAPAGITEILVVKALEKLKEEGAAMATFGPAPAKELGRVAGLGTFAESVARGVFNAAGRVFHLDSRTRYRKKFQVAQMDPSFVLFEGRSLHLLDLVGLFRAFNVSVAF